MSDAKRLDFGGEAEVTPLFVGVVTLCDMLEIKRTRAYHLINAGDVQSRLVGSSRRIDVNSIHALKGRLPAQRSR